MFTVTIKTNDKTISKQYNNRVRADKVLSDANIILPKHCGGNGKCGKCNIILNGNKCLACQTTINSDSVIIYSRKESDILGLTNSNISLTSKNPIVKEGFGAAIDIGTTTVACYIYKFPECQLVKTTCLPNPQIIYGADVISRINSACKQGISPLKSAITELSEKLTQGFDIEKFVICGNTAMLYFLVGEDPGELAIAPYNANNLFGKWQDNKYLIRCSSAFVGGDITAAVLASNMNNDNVSLLVDIGTNGEMVIKYGPSKICCSTAAGPCFEGAGIECGTPAVSGAINSVFIENGAVKFTTIGDAEPIGICGTGLIDAVAVLRELSLIDETGYMESEFYFGESSIFISPMDIRNYQMAKSAIRSGIDALIHHSGIGYNDIEKFYISGGFGSYLNIKSAIKTGLIPNELENKAIILGNGAGAGASLILLNEHFIEKSCEIADSTDTLSLSTDSFFMDKYMENMSFK